MRFESTTVISHPRPDVFAAYRDRLPEVVPYLPNIASIEIKSKEDAGEVVKLHNVWTGAASEIPAIVKGFLPSGALSWDDFASWDASSHQCTFRIRIPAFGEAVRCDGTNTFTTTPAGTQVALAGDFVVDVAKIPGVPRLLAGRIGPSVEGFVLKLLQPNLEKTAAAVGAFLDALKGA